MAERQQDKMRKIPAGSTVAPKKTQIKRTKSAKLGVRTCIEKRGVTIDDNGRETRQQTRRGKKAT